MDSADDRPVDHNSVATRTDVRRRRCRVHRGGEWHRIKPHRKDHCRRRELRSHAGRRMKIEQPKPGQPIFVKILDKEYELRYPMRVIKELDRNGMNLKG